MTTTLRKDITAPNGIQYDYEMEYKAFGSEETQPPITVTIYKKNRGSEEETIIEMTDDLMKLFTSYLWDRKIVDDFNKYATGGLTL